LSLTTNQEIENFLESFEKQSKALKQEALRMCWYMRGGLSYAEVMHLSSQERDLIAKIVEDNIATTKKSGLPFF
jgi:hypothetical protein